MSYQLEIYTEQLLDIIQILQQQRAVGVLQVRRGEGITAEEGTITFSNGRTTDARTGRRVGPEAVSWISSWPGCRVKFFSNDPTFSLEKILRMIGRSPANNAFYPLNTQGGNYTSMPGVRTIPPLRGQWSAAETGLVQSGDTSPDVHTSGSLRPVAIDLIIPTMLVELDMALCILEANGLTRTHRQLLLLTDGRRRIGEFVRLTRRDSGDVYRLLQDMEQIHIIQFTTG